MGSAKGFQRKNGTTKELYSVSYVCTNVPILTVVYNVEAYSE